MPKHGKNMRDALARIDRTARYSLSDGVELAKAVAFAKFDESVDLAVNLNVNPRHADQMVRGACVLPHGLGKTVRVAVFAKGDKAEAARAAGADVVGDEDLVAKIQGGWVDFDVCEDRIPDGRLESSGDLSEVHDVEGSVLDEEDTVAGIAF